MGRRSLSSPTSLVPRPSGRHQVFAFQTFGVSPKTSAEQQRENTFFRPVCLALSGGRDSSQDMNEFKFASATCASVARGPISKKSCSKSWGIGNGNRLASLSLRSQNHFARPMEHITSGKAFAGWISQPDLFVLTVSCFVSHTGLPSVFFYQSPALKVQSRKWLRCASSCEMTEKWLQRLSQQSAKGPACAKNSQPLFATSMATWLSFGTRRFRGSDQNCHLCRGRFCPEQSAVQNCSGSPTATMFCYFVDYYRLTYMQQIYNIYMVYCISTRST